MKQRMLRCACHSYVGKSTLLLLMLWVLADYHNISFSLDDLAFLADLLDGWFYLHCPYRTFLAFVVVPD